MDKLKKRFAILFIPVALIVFTSFLVAQGPPTPNPCAKTCQQIYAEAVQSCHGDQACLAAARAAALNCLKGCGITR
jgi:hypothetical protein